MYPAQGSTYKVGQCINHFPQVLLDSKQNPAGFIIPYILQRSWNCTARPPVLVRGSQGSSVGQHHFFFALMLQCTCNDLQRTKGVSLISYINCTHSSWGKQMHIQLERGPINKLYLEFKACKQNYLLRLSYEYQWSVQMQLTLVCSKSHSKILTCGKGNITHQHTNVPVKYIYKGIKEWKPPAERLVKLSSTADG